MKIISYIFIAGMLMGALVLDYLDEVNNHAIRTASAQEPKRWKNGDTIWYEIDSIPYLPSTQEQDSLRMLGDSLHGAWYPPMLLDNVHQPSLTLPATAKIDYHLPYWNVYRRSFTYWGITFSTGQPNPYNPYPESNALDASVISHPLNRPK